MSNEDIQSKVTAFFSQYPRFSLQQSEVLIHHGEKSQWVYYVTKGVIKQSATTSQGQETTITFYKPGSLIPLVWVVKDKVIPYDLTAVTLCDGWKAPREEFLEFLKQHNDVLFDLSTRLLSALEGFSRKLDFALRATAQLRVTEALMTLAYRFGNGKTENVEIELEMTHQELGDITGLSRETVTRELTVLREKGAVTIDKNMFTIPSLGVLERSIMQ